MEMRFEGITSAAEIYPLYLLLPYLYSTHSVMNVESQKRDKILNRNSKNEFFSRRVALLKTG